MALHLQKAYAGLRKNSLDALLVSSPANISYLTQHHSREAYLLFSPKARVYFTDSRYLLEASKFLGPGFSLCKIDASAWQIIAAACRRLGLVQVGFEERHLTHADYKRLRQCLGSKIRLVATQGLIEQMRQVKTPAEIRKIKKATDITVRALKFIRGFIRPGRREIEIAGELERFIRYAGGHGSAFNIIVASGPNSSFPHHITSHRKIKRGEPVLIDIGTDYFGYKSDLTRVFFLGKISVLARRVYDIVRRANALAAKEIRPGVPISAIDAASRAYIRSHGWAEHFTHSLGHGIGLEVHEAPRISGKNNEKLKPGMVFTIEPAVYLPGKFGVRIEDTVLVTQKGCQVLSGSLDK
jgi:Xaa-Pro aminopeptidase